MSIRPCKRSDKSTLPLDGIFLRGTTIRRTKQPSVLHARDPPGVRSAGQFHARWPCAPQHSQRIGCITHSAAIWPACPQAKHIGRTEATTLVASTSLALASAPEQFATCVPEQKAMGVTPL